MTDIGNCAKLLRDIGDGVYGRHTYDFAVGTGRVEGVDFYDWITFTAAEGTYPNGLYATMTGTMHGTIGSSVGASAQGRCRAYLGPEMYDSGLFTTEINESRTIVVDELFTLVLEIVQPGATLNHPTDYSHGVRLGFYHGRASSAEYNTGTGHVTGDADINFTDGLQITSFTASPGVTWVSESGAFVGGVSSVPLVAQRQLHQNAPNPFNPQTTIAFDLPKQTTVSLRVFDMSGRLVRVLVDGVVVAEGHHESLWNGRDDAGRRVASGTYFYRLEAGEYSKTKRMSLIK